MKIVCLVPSLSKTICDLGLKKDLVGVTNFCVDPPDLYRAARRIGGTKDPDLNLICEINPTHVVLNEEENRLKDVEFLKSRFQTLVTFPKSPSDVPGLFRQLGNFLNICPEADVFANKIEAELMQWDSAASWSQEIGKRFLYLIWRDPWMAASRDTYISRFLELLGLQNVICDDNRYPVVDISKYTKKDVDLIFMSSEPWAFRKRDAEGLRALLSNDCPTLYWIDGKACSWYGSQTLEALSAARKGPVAGELIKSM